MTSLQFGWVLPMPGEREAITQTAFLEHLSQEMQFVAKHFHSVWCCDHLQFNNYQVLEGWTMLTYLAALYPQLHFGTLVLSQSYRNPALLAKMAATFQYMSNGRLLLGIGAGWHEEEYKAYGYPFPSARTRVAELEEALQIIRSLWQEESVTIQGKHYQVVEARCEPKPTPLPPMIIGGSKPAMLNLIARYADWWSADRGDIDVYRNQLAQCEAACLAVQRDPMSLRRTWFGDCICRTTENALQSFREQFPAERGCLVGTPSQIRERMQQFIDLGVDYFMIHTRDFPDLGTLELLVSEVFPTLQCRDAVRRKE
jgi:alkanesulfonate monooxygenase SsuD/methylene tetrahydromethanopterin reductase-like flavin-dependent oxidoreductase (luciferase family)